MTETELSDLEECSQMFDFIGFTPTEDRQLLAEVRRLRQALIDYGEHGRGPDHRPCPTGFEPGALCTCGLSKAWGEESA